MLSQLYLTFLAVAQSKSFSAASEKLFISPVSVMKQINALEASLNVQLFNRSNRGVSLTQAGHYLYTETLNLQDKIVQVINHAKAVSDQDKIIINVGASVMRPADRLVAIWRNANEQLNGYNLRIVSFNDQDVTMKSPSTDIGNGLDCIVGPCDAGQWSGHYSIFVLGYEKFKIAVPLRDTLVNKSVLSIKDLFGRTLIVPPLDAGVVRQLSETLATQYPTIHIVNTDAYYSPNTFSRNPSELVLTRDSFENLAPTHRVVDIDWDYQSPYGIIYAKSPSKKVENFIQVIKNLN